MGNVGTGILFNKMFNKKGGISGFAVSILIIVFERSTARSPVDCFSLLLHFPQCNLATDITGGSSLKHMQLPPDTQKTS